MVVSVGQWLYSPACSVAVGLAWCWAVLIAAWYDTISAHRAPDQGGTGEHHWTEANERRIQMVLEGW